MFIYIYRNTCIYTVVADVARRCVASTMAAIASAAESTNTPAPLVRADGHPTPRMAGNALAGVFAAAWPGCSRAGMTCVAPPASRRAQGAPPCRRSATPLPVISNALTFQVVCCTGCRSEVGGGYGHIYVYEYVDIYIHIYIFIYAPPWRRSATPLPVISNALTFHVVC